MNIFMFLLLQNVSSHFLYFESTGYRRIRLNYLGVKLSIFSRRATGNLLAKEEVKYDGMS